MTPPDKKVQTVDSYIASFPKDVQKILQSIRETIKKAAPEAQEKISYSIPAFMQNGMLIYYAAWKEHIGMYPVTTEMEKSIKELSSYNTSGKGTVRFPLDKPAPLDLIKRMVLFRIEENLKREKT